MQVLRTNLRGAAFSHQDHPTSGLMQILHFDWLRYQRTISNSHRVAKSLHLQTLLLKPNTANQNSEKPSYIRRYSTQPSHRALHAYLIPVKKNNPLYFSWHGIKQLCNTSTWYTMEYPTCNLYFLGIHTRLKARLYIEKILVCNHSNDSQLLSSTFMWYYLLC